MSGNREASRIFLGASALLRHRSMRPVVRTFSGLHAWLYRLTGGRAQVPGYPTLLLTVSGRKTGKPRTAPLVYVTDGERFVVAAAYSGSETDPVWWLNLRDRGEAVVDVGSKTVRVRAALATPDERERYWPRLVAVYPPFTEYQKRTTREFPVIVLTPIAGAEPIHATPPSTAVPQHP